MTPDLNYCWGGAGEWCEDNKWDEEKEKCCKGILLLPHTAPLSGSGIFLFVCVHSSP